MIGKIRRGFRFGFDNGVTNDTIFLPTRHDSTNIGVGGAYQGTINDFLRILGENFPSKSMPTMLRDSNNMTQCFSGFRRKTRVHFLVVNLLPKEELEENTDVNGGSSQAIKRNITNAAIVRVV